VLLGYPNSTFSYLKTIDIIVISVLIYKKSLESISEEKDILGEVKSKFPINNFLTQTKNCAKIIFRSA